MSHWKVRDLFNSIRRIPLTRAEEAALFAAQFHKQAEVERAEWESNAAEVVRWCLDRDGPEGLDFAEWVAQTIASDAPMPYSLCEQIGIKERT